MDRSKLNLTTTESVKKFESDLFVQTKTIKELPACLFIDSQYLLTVELLPGQKNDMKSKELNEFCKLHGVEQKVEMSYHEMNKLFVSNEKEELTTVFEYAAHDVRVLYNLFKKTGVMSKYIDIARFTNTSIIDVLHKPSGVLLTQKLQRLFLESGKQLPYCYKHIDGELSQSYDGAAN